MPRVPDRPMTPAGLVQSLLDLDDPRSIELRRTITLSEIIEWARQARESESPEPTKVERVIALLDEMGMRLASFAPHGLDSSRMDDYGLASDLRRCLDEIRATLGYERKYGPLPMRTPPYL